MLSAKYEIIYTHTHKLLSLVLSLDRVSTVTLEIMFETPLIKMQ
jgi:hypothetical protein